MTTRSRDSGITLAVGLTVAAALQLATGWAIQTDRVPLRDPLYQEKFATLRMHPGFTTTAGERPLRVVFLGSSRTLDAIDAGAVGPALAEQVGRPIVAFNFAVHGAGPVTNALYLRRLLADGVKPDAVMIEVHPVFLASQMAAPPESRWLSSSRLRPGEVPIAQRLGFPACEPTAHGPRGWLLPWYEFRAPMIDRYATTLSLQPYPLAPGQLGNESGFLRCREVAPSERPRFLDLTRRQYAEFLPGYRPGGCGTAAVRDSLETCRVAGVRAALVLTPESSEFRSWYPEPGRSRITPLLIELAREFGCPLVDAREWLADELIGDGHHLTGTGADAFTERLTREALAPWLRLPEGGAR